MEKLIYDSFSVYKFIKTNLVRIISIVFAYLAIINYKWNPELTTFVIVVSVYAFLIASQERILLYKDRFVIKNGSIIPFYLINDEYLLELIEKIIVTGDFTLDEDISSDINKYDYERPNKIEIVYKSGLIVELRSRVYKNDLDKFLNKLHSLGTKIVSESVNVTNSTFP